MVLEITHPEKPTIQDKIDDNDYMAAHTITGELPDFTGLSPGKIRLPVLIEEKTITEPVSTITFSNLNGDTDKEYYLVSKLTVTRQSKPYSNIRLNLNGDTENSKSYAVGGVSGSNPSKIETSFIVIGFTDNSATAQVNSLINLYALSGKVRNFLGEIVSQRSTYISVYNLGGYWSNTADNITSVVISATDNGTFAGTIKLYKIIDIPIEDLST